MSQVSVMYVGRKAQKTNRPTGHVWNGLGDVVLVSPLEWQKELQTHPDIWMDVTKLDEKARAKIVNGIKEQIRAERRAMQTRVLLSDAGDDEIQEEWDRRHGKPLKLVSKAKTNVPPADRRGAEGENPLDGEAAERPSTTKEVVDAIVSAIRSLDVDNEALFDAEDNPTQEAVEAALHYKISKSELKAGIAANLELLKAG